MRQRYILGFFVGIIGYAVFAYSLCHLFLINIFMFYFIMGNSDSKLKEIESLRVNKMLLIKLNSSTSTSHALTTATKRTIKKRNG